MSTILGITEIQEILPQRSPFLMLDRVQLGEESTELTAIKNVTTNEIQFSGHFPGNPIMPGVLQVEAMKQAATIAFKRSTAVDAGAIIIKSVKKTRFKNPITPGDQVIIAVKISNVTAESCDVTASCKSNGKVNSQSTFSLAVISLDELNPKSFTTDFKADILAEGADVIYNSTQIASYIPHRFPFHFIDKVIAVEGENRIIGQKLVSINEPFGNAYFPEKPFMPNIMILEIAAQLGCVKLLSMDEHKGKIGLFLSIEDTVINRPAIPGDLLSFDVEFLYFKSVMGKAKAIISCGDEIICEMVMAFALVHPEA